MDYDVDGQPVPAYAVHGSPAQAVLYALVELVPRARTCAWLASTLARTSARA